MYPAELMVVKSKGHNARKLSISPAHLEVLSHGVLKKEQNG